MAYQNERLSPRQWIWAWWNLRKLKRIPVYRAALDEVRRLMNDDNFKWWMSKTMRLKFSNRILEGLGVVSQVPNAVLANRELLCNELIECAHYGVLVLPAAPGDDTTGLRGQLGITGELRSHLEEALRESDHFKDRSGNMGQDLEDVGREEFYPLCYVGYLQAQSTICVFDKVRRELNDHIAEPGRDWLWPTATALYAWEEHGHRQRLGLPEAEGMDGMIALRASTILNIVMEGAKNPLYEWEKRFEQKFPWRSSEEHRPEVLAAKG